MSVKTKTDITSRERVFRIFKGESVDRVACFEQTIACSVASDILGRRALTGGSALDYYEACAWWESEDAHEAFARQVLQDTLDLAEVLQFDMVRLRPSNLDIRPTKRLDTYTFCFTRPGDDTEVTMKFDPDVHIWGVVEAPDHHYDPYRHVETMETALEELTDDQICSGLTDLDWLVGKTKGRKVVLDRTGEISIPFREEWLLVCIDDPLIVTRYLNCMAELAIRKLPFVKEHGADVIWAGGLLGGREGPIYGPAVFRELLLPHLKRIVAKCHELALPYLYRTDGNISSVANELLVESGIDGYGVSDADTGMNIGQLRKDFPNLVLSGNVSPKVLHRGSVEDVISETKRCIDGARGGGHILGSANSVIHGTPAKNVIAMFETARKYGRY